MASKYLQKAKNASVSAGSSLIQSTKSLKITSSGGASPRKSSKIDAEQLNLISQNEGEEDKLEMTNLDEEAIPLDEKTEATVAPTSNDSPGAEKKRTSSKPLSNLASLAKSAAEKTAEGTKIVASKTAVGTKLAASATLSATKKAAVKTAEGTKIVAAKTAEGTKIVAAKTAEGTKIVAAKTAEGTKIVAAKTAEGTKIVAAMAAEGTKLAVSATVDATQKAQATVSEALFTKKASSSDLLESSFVAPVEEEVENPAMFGIAIEKTVLDEAGNVIGDLPLVVSDAIKAILDNEWYIEEGIFRLSTSLMEMNATKKKYNLREEVTYTNQSDPHLPACTLKLFLRSLPEPLLTNSLSPQFHDAVVDPTQSIPKLKDLLDQLPPVNRKVLHEVLSLLTVVANHHHINRMVPSNLAIIFVPAFNLNSSDLFDALLANHQQLFSEPTIVSTHPKYPFEVSTLSDHTSQSSLSDAPPPPSEELSHSESLIISVQTENEEPDPCPVAPKRGASLLIKTGEGTPSKASRAKSPRSKSKSSSKTRSKGKRSTSSKLTPCKASLVNHENDESGMDEASSHQADTDPSITNSVGETISEQPESTGTPGDTTSSVDGGDHSTVDGGVVETTTTVDGAVVETTTTVDASEIPS